MKLVAALAALVVVASTAADVVSAQSPLKAGTAAFFWFDSKKVSATGNPFYGAHAYRAVLPEMSPKRRAVKGDFAYFDGDLLAASPPPHQGGAETAVAEQVQQLGSLAYAIAIYAYQDAPPFRDADRALRAAGVVGYLGVTTTTPMEIERFVRVARQMALPVAMKQEGPRLRIVNLGFMSLQELRQMGFEPEVVSK